MSGGYIGAVDVTVRFEFDETRDLAVDNGDPRLLDLASLALFCSPVRAVDIHGRRPGVTLFLAVVVASEFVDGVVVDFANREFVTGLVFSNHSEMCKFSSQQFRDHFGAIVKIWSLHTRLLQECEPVICQGSVFFWQNDMAPVLDSICSTAGQ